MKSPVFTGERFIPGQGGREIAYEHLHRYIFSTRFAQDRAVLDVAAGSGYGADILARVARRVWAIEIDGGAVEYARQNYRARNLVFLQSDATLLPFLPGCMELVVAMEVLEHIERQEELVQEIARVLRRDGVALISTPNKAAYSDARNYSNPFHVRELYRKEFLDLLMRHFASVELLTQKICTGSLIVPERGRTEDGEIARDSDGRAPHDSAAALYFVAVCRHEETGSSGAGESAYLCPADQLVEEWLREAKRQNDEIHRLGRWGEGLNAMILEKGKSITQLQEEASELKLRISGLLQELSERDRTVRSVQEEMRFGVEGRDDTIRNLQREFAERTNWILELERTVRERDASIVDANRRTEDAEERIRDLANQLGRIQRAFLYRVLRRIGLIPG